MTPNKLLENMINELMKSMGLSREEAYTLAAMKYAEFMGFNNMHYNITNTDNNSRPNDIEVAYS